MNEQMKVTNRMRISYRLWLSPLITVARTVMMMKMMMIIVVIIIIIK